MIVEKKTIKRFQECENEINICEKIKKIPYFFLYFNPIINYKLLQISNIDVHSLENSDALNNNNYALLSKKHLFYPSFSLFFNSLTQTKEKVVRLFDSYTYLLKAIHELNRNEVVYFNITSEKIGFNEKKQPILQNFSESFNYNGFKAKILPSVYSLPLEVHIISFLQDPDFERKSISQTNIEDICKNFIIKNQALKGFSQEFIKEFYKKCVRHVLSLSIVNEPREKIVSHMMNFSNTWDNYSLSALFLPIITKIREEMGMQNKFFDKFTELLLLNMDPDPKKRIAPIETINAFESLFDECDVW